MSKATLDLCFTEVRGVLEGTLGLATASIERGRRPRSIRKSPWALMRARTSRREALVTAARLRLYEIEVLLFRRQGDVPEGTTQADEMETLQEQLYDAFDAKTINDYAPIIGLTVTRATMASRDEPLDDDESRDEVMSRTVIGFPVWESI